MISARRLNTLYSSKANMSDFKDLILSTYKTKPKHFTRILKNNKELKQYIDVNVPKTINTFLYQLNFIVTGDNGQCHFGKQKKPVPIV